MLVGKPNGTRKFGVADNLHATYRTAVLRTYLHLVLLVQAKTARCQSAARIGNAWTHAYHNDSCQQIECLPEHSVSGNHCATIP